MLLVLLAACAPQSTSNQREELTAATLQIAAEYQATGNLDGARAQLSVLDVANPQQWLLYVTETAIQENQAASTVAALVKLSEDLGLESTAVRQYAVQNNLLSAAKAASVAVQTDTTTIDASPTPPLVEPTATAQPVESTVAMTPTATPQTQAQVQAIDLLNVRAGPGTTYDLVGALQKDETALITGKNPEGSWWQVTLASGQQGWVFGELVTTVGDTAAVAIAANIPPAPLIPVATPVAVAQAPSESQPTEAPTPAPDPNAAPYFTLVSKRLWGKEENDGCVGKHLLRIHVIDANGIRLNGVRLKGIYLGQELVTGDQGKGDGIIEYDLHGTGEGFTVIRNDDGREAGSDRAEGFTTRSVDIPIDLLIPAGYCTNAEDCQVFYNSWGCQGHHSWEATFQRNY